MSYARSRLLLGICGVGFFVLASIAAILSGSAASWLPGEVTWSPSDVGSLLAVYVCFAALMTPFDLIGGYVLPKRAGTTQQSTISFLVGWLRGVCVHAAFFLTASLLLLALGRLYGAFGASVGVLLLGSALITWQLELGRLTGSLGLITELSTADQDRITAAMRQTSAWGWRPRPLILLTHQDPGFTGGVVGLPGREKIALPAGMLNRLSSDELAATVARRLEAIDDGSRNRGIIVALIWVLLGFNLSMALPHAGASSVSELTTTCLGFTLWTFLGLLILPTLSRQASFAIDNKVIQRGISQESLHRSVSKFDRFQDDEPERPRLIETIFHPVPSASRRSGDTKIGPPIAWHAARMTLFLSWACMGTLVRAVHCNVGRPELWVMYPTD